MREERERERASRLQAEVSAWVFTSNSFELMKTSNFIVILSKKHRAFNWETKFIKRIDRQKESWTFRWKQTLISTSLNMKELQLFEQHAKFKTCWLSFELRQNVAKQRDTTRNTVNERGMFVQHLRVNPRKKKDFLYRRHDSEVDDEYNSVRC